MGGSDGPEDEWAAAHEDDLIGLRDDEASAVVRAAGFLPAIVRPAEDHGLAAMQVAGQVTMCSVDGRIRRVRSPRRREDGVERPLDISVARRRRSRAMIESLQAWLPHGSR